MKPKCYRCPSPGDTCDRCGLADGDQMERTVESYRRDELFRSASEIEVEGYMEWTRVEEIAELCERMVWKSVGVAFCVGLAEEARALCEFLEGRGLEVYSVCCKVGGVPKSKLSLLELKPGDKVCNPRLQARLLNEIGTDLNVLVGLCVGHDIIFIEESEAPVTVAVVKDRRLAHCPALALTNRYYRRKLGLE
ncbi:DUF1847 domain-containing protein [Methanopyrus kandleri]|uniref:Uncharacterized metal-binding protein conserved in archaea n=2 Tax=Methanopyrus kandleri TaxID=2320 RepID=Q8TXT9_METKA|nr:DUF1847 domain-containing protein [Methanopyrus kandleri]AAM01786.1 Uncharacterized metal-binding protein conserved in archaea [Methanopyrus kandleri AV19]